MESRRIGSGVVPIAMAFGLIYLFAAGGCSEESPPVQVDEDPPHVAIEQPVATSVYGATVEDSVRIFVAAEDNEAVERIELYLILHDETEPTLIGTLTEPDSTGSYSLIWETAAFENGSTGSIYAVAYDQAGNQSDSDKVPVLLINQSEIGPPVARFLVIPSEGSVTTLFEFDASVTVDALAEPIDILVRWDFDGDGFWDIDTTQNKKASELVTYSYAVPDTYTVIMEAFNEYYSLETGVPGRTTKELVVKPESGIPDPPEAIEFIEIPAGTYPLGALECLPGEACGDTDEDETLADTLLIRLSNPYFIGKYEVTNEQYAVYLNSAFDADTLISYDRQSREVRSLESGKLLLVLDQALTRMKFQLVDSTFWVDEQYADHPVTGVSWYGASEFAGFYGLRLPTEAEWEVAARGNQLERGNFYPWTPATEVDAAYANYWNSGDPFEDAGSPRSTTPVGAYDGTAIEGTFATNDAVSPTGTYDQAGNVAEWVRDRYAANVYDALLAEYQAGNPPLDPQGPSAGGTATQRVVRGGSFMNRNWDLRVTNRAAADPFRKADWLGFRVAYIEF